MKINISASELLKNCKESPITFLTVILLSFSSYILLYKSKNNYKVKTTYSTALSSLIEDAFKKNIYTDDKLANRYKVFYKRSTIDVLSKAKSLSEAKTYNDQIQETINNHFSFTTNQIFNKTKKYFHTNDITENNIITLTSILEMIIYEAKTEQILPLEYIKQLSSLHQVISRRIGLTNTESQPEYSKFIKEQFFNLITHNKSYLDKHFKKRTSVVTRTNREVMKTAIFIQLLFIFISLPILSILIQMRAGNK